jgi:serine/threonine protein kinase
MNEHDMDFLTQIPGFDSIDRSGWAIISQCVERFNFPRSSYLLRQGEPGDRMYIVVEGEVEVLGQDHKGRSKLLARLGAGDIVGEMALLTDLPRVADAVAVGDVTALGIRRVDLEPLLRQSPSLARFLSELLGRRLEEGDGIRQVGKYRLAGLLGQGGSSKVFTGVHPTLNRVVAVKMLSHSLAYDEHFRQRFLNEARTIAALSHPNIIQIFDVEEAFATFFIIMEKITGRDLASVLIEDGVMEPDLAMAILTQVGQALQLAHARGIVHRDVKPGNCAIDDQGVVKLMDFGIAARIEPDGEGARRTIVEGTPYYLAPEAALGRPVDGRADIYALGVMGFRMVAGQHPFNAAEPQEILRAHLCQPVPDVRSLQPDLPQSLVDFIHGALIKEPDDRLSDWEQIFELLESENPRRTWAPMPSRERIVRIRFSLDAEDVVDDACHALEQTLTGHRQIDLAWADLKKG